MDSNYLEIFEEILFLRKDLTFKKLSNHRHLGGTEIEQRMAKYYKYLATFLTYFGNF